MRAILFVYLAALFRRAGIDAESADESARAIFHAFVASAYALPMIGAVVADRWLGKYRTIVSLSLVYCAGHACLAMFEGDLTGTLVGLVLIALGAGGIKPCVSAHVGDQFGNANRHRLERIYQVFYFTINFGAFFASIAIPRLKESAGFSWAFAVPGILMGIATIVFYAGRRRFVHVPPMPGGVSGAIDAAIGSFLFLALLAPMFGNDLSPWYARLGVGEKIAIATFFLAAAALLARRRAPTKDDAGLISVTVHAILGRRSESASYRDEELELGRFWAPSVRAFGPEMVHGAIAAYRMVGVVGITSVFWSLFDQQGSTWIAQAATMDRTVALGAFRFSLLPEEITAANPILVMLFVPLFAGVVYPLVARAIGRPFGQVQRMGTGLVIAAFSFVLLAIAQQRLDSGAHVSVGWQLAASAVITVAEVMVAVTGLELGYTAAPKRMKSTISGLFLLGISAGNLIVTFATHTVHVPAVTWFWGFAGLMLAAAALFWLVARGIEPGRASAQASNA